MSPLIQYERHLRRVPLGEPTIPRLPTDIGERHPHYPATPVLGSVVEPRDVHYLKVNKSNKVAKSILKCYVAKWFFPDELVEIYDLHPFAKWLTVMVVPYRPASLQLTDDDFEALRTQALWNRGLTIDIGVTVKEGQSKVCGKHLQYMHYILQIVYIFRFLPPQESVPVTSRGTGSVTKKRKVAFGDDATTTMPQAVTHRTARDGEPGDEPERKAKGKKWPAHRPPHYIALCRVEADTVAPEVIPVAMFEEEAASPMLNVGLVAYVSFVLLRYYGMILNREDSC
ncbi:hypothetical protein EDD15DRAFT_2200313 [Pisolithus albus]|nr:hypothetical protein EDD15DRAFT_2200313 [Pisolithus albus]